MKNMQNETTPSRSTPHPGARNGSRAAHLLRIFLLSVLASGCFTLGSGQTASTLGAGHAHGGVEAGMAAIAVPDAHLAETANMPRFGMQPAVNGFFRYGVTDRLDLGFRVGTPFLELHGKVLFTPPEHRWVALSFAPALGGYYAPSICAAATVNTCSSALGSVYLAVPLLFGVKLGPHELVFGVREQNTLMLRREAHLTNTRASFIVGLGASFGFALAVHDTLVIMPEVAAVTAVYESKSGLYNGTGYGVGTWQMTFGISFMRGRRRGTEAPPAAEPELSPPPMPPPDVAPPPPPPPPAEL